MHENIPKLTCWGGAGSVTGANFLLEAAGLKILIDCGLTQGSHDAFELNRAAFPYDPATIDYLFVTHGHLDHVGRIGKLVKDGFRGTIYSTPQTRAIGALIMEDAVGLLARESEKMGVLPMYEMKDVELARSFWKEISYHTQFAIPAARNGDEVGGGAKGESSETSGSGGLSLYIKDAGHILGSSIFEFTLPHYDKKWKTVFTGDLGNSPSPILRDTETVTDATYMIMESVYGDRNHEPAPERLRHLRQTIIDTTKRGGVLVIPAFSVERTQVILYELNGMMEKNEIPNVPVFVDSPLATKVTEIYRHASALFNPAAQKLISSGDNIFEFPRLKFTVATEDSRAIYNHAGPKIVLAGSGMSMGGRVTFHESHCLPDARNTILLVGYQTMGSLGRQLQEGEKIVRINGIDVPVHAHIDAIFGYSSHKDSDHLLEFVSHTEKTVKHIFVAMGEPKASLFFSRRLRDELDIEAEMPERGKVYELK